MVQVYRNVREVVGIFDNHIRMEETIADLENSGIGRHLISVLGSEAAIKKQFGKNNPASDLLKDHPQAPRSPDIKQEELSVAQGAIISSGILTGVVAAIIAAGAITLPGALVTTIMIGGVGGGAVGAILAKLLGDKYASYFQQQIDQGGILLWVTSPDTDIENKALAVLKEHNARDIHVHELPASMADKPAGILASV